MRFFPLHTNYFESDETKTVPRINLYIFKCFSTFHFRTFFLCCVSIRLNTLIRSSSLLKRFQFFSLEICYLLIEKVFFFSERIYFIFLLQQNRLSTSNSIQSTVATTKKKNVNIFSLVCFFWPSQLEIFRLSGALI